ncbi:hypothetical protein [Pseudonocardia spinosispora]|uniref:hypothetical protein n=1 Tax=Pseudonocardia spinosispora TaxID=103441 RepID=UPI0003F786CB|nr:hypothetical protein [Pseudonocardia spinosispora]
MSELRLGVDIRARGATGVLLDVDDTILAELTVPGPGAPADLLRTVVGDLADDRRTAIGAVVIASSVPAEGLTVPSELSRVGVLRIGAPAATSVPPLTGWPAELTVPVGGPVAMIRGGHRYDGEELAALDLDGVAEFGRTCRGVVGAVAVSAIDSHVNALHEQRAVALLSDLLGPGVPIIAGYRAGGSGLLERENTAVLDAALATRARRFVEDCGAGLAEAGVAGDLYLTGGDGTVAPASWVADHPLHTLDAVHGAARAGAAQLTGRRSLVVVDVDEERVRISAQSGGLPVETGTPTVIRGVRLGTRQVRGVEVDHSGPSARRPATVRRVARAVERVRAGLLEVPLVMVGTRADTVPAPTGMEVLRPVHAACASAVGAAGGQASGSVDRLFWLGGDGMAECVEAARVEAKDAAIRSGADPARLTVGDVREALMTYVPVGCVRLRVTATGPIMSAPVGPVEEASR